MLVLFSLEFFHASFTLAWTSPVYSSQLSSNVTSFSICQISSFPSYSEIGLLPSPCHPRALNSQNWSHDIKARYITIKSKPDLMEDKNIAPHLIFLSIPGVLLNVWRLINAYWINSCLFGKTEKMSLFNEQWKVRKLEFWLPVVLPFPSEDFPRRHSFFIPAEGIWGLPERVSWLSWITVMVPRERGNLWSAQAVTFI